MRSSLEKRSRRVHLVEPGGWGGVHQHTAALARALAEAGVPVTLHTAADGEAVPSEVAWHACFWRFRGIRPLALRRAAVVIGWLAAGIPSCLVRARPGDVVHLQGWFARPGLMAPLAAGARLRGCSLAFTPHTTFSRQARRTDERVVRSIARRSDVAFCFSEHEQRILEAWGARAVRVPLALLSPPADPALVAAWRRRWAASDGSPVVLLAGQLRSDKGLDLLIQAASESSGRLTVAVVGEDHGVLSEARRLAEMLGVVMTCDEGYHPLDRFVAALAAADVVACPYRIATTSAVLAMARTLGRPSVATRVGGLPELATVVVPPGDPGALAAGIRRALDARPPRRDGFRDLARRHLAGYGW